MKKAMAFTNMSFYQNKAIQQKFSQINQDSAKRQPTRIKSNPASGAITGWEGSNFMVTKEHTKVDILGKSMAFLAETPSVYMNSQTMNSQSNPRKDKQKSNLEFV